MVDVVLDNAKPDNEALKSPQRERWCQGQIRTSLSVDRHFYSTVTFGTQFFRNYTGTYNLSLIHI